MSAIAEIETKIRAIEFALGSFADYDNDDEAGRQNFLRANFTAVPGLNIYFEDTYDKLRENNTLLQELKLEKRRQLLEEKRLQVEAMRQLLEEKREENSKKGSKDCPDWVLAEINTLSKLSSIRVKVLVSQVIQYCLEGELNYEKVLKLAADNADGLQDLKGAIAALHFMISNSAKYDTDDKVLIQEIQQLGLPKENSDMIAKQYRETKE
eukprot:gene38480-46772_t